ncbi:MAG TPA: hypothetical protein VN026_13605 [Bacteroidia bacterium]|nr:hypothetical protein [Bacteroidia bacterium]
MKDSDDKPTVASNTTPKPVTPTATPTTTPATSTATPPVTTDTSGNTSNPAGRMKVGTKSVISGDICEWDGSNWVNCKPLKASSNNFSGVAGYYGSNGDNGFTYPNPKLKGKVYSNYVNGQCWTCSAAEQRAGRCSKCGISSGASVNLGQ